MTAPQLAEQQLTRTWCDGHGVWHCEVVTPAPGHRLKARYIAEVAIVAEIRQRNPRDILTGLCFVGLRVTDTNPALAILHYREEDGT